MADINDALVGADDEAGQDHPLDHQMRHVIEDEAILDGARLALVGVAHDVLRRAYGRANDLPLRARRESGAAEATKVAGPERPQQAGHVPRLDERADGLVPPSVGVGVEVPVPARALAHLREHDVVGRIDDDTVVCDLRTVDPVDDERVGRALAAASA